VVTDPFPVVTVTGPLVAPLGTVTSTDCTDVEIGPTAGVPLKVTDLTPSKYCPHKITFCPTGPDQGYSPETAGKGLGQPKSMLNTAPVPNAPEPPYPAMP
jgi:hypothetical protein